MKLFCWPFIILYITISYCKIFFLKKKLLLISFSDRWPLSSIWGQKPYILIQLLINQDLKKYHQSFPNRDEKCSREAKQIWCKVLKNKFEIKQVSENNLLTWPFGKKKNRNIALNGLKNYPLWPWRSIVPLF